MIAFTGTARLLAGSISTLNKWEQEEEEEEEDGTNTQIKLYIRKRKVWVLAIFGNFSFYLLLFLTFLNYSSFKILI